MPPPPKPSWIWAFCLRFIAAVAKLVSRFHCVYYKMASPTAPGERVGTKTKNQKKNSPRKTIPRLSQPWRFGKAIGAICDDEPLTLDGSCYHADICPPSSPAGIGSRGRRTRPARSLPRSSVPPKASRAPRSCPSPIPRRSTSQRVRGFWMHASFQGRTHFLTHSLFSRCGIQKKIFSVKKKFSLLVVPTVTGLCYP